MLYLATGLWIVGPIQALVPVLVRDYYHVGVIGYGQNVGPAFSGDLLGQDIVPVSKIAESPARVEERTKKVEDGAGGLIEQAVKFPVWFDPKAAGSTPMCKAFQTAHDALSPWVADWLPVVPFLAFVGVLLAGSALWLVRSSFGGPDGGWTLQPWRDVFGTRLNRLKQSLRQTVLASEK